MKKLFSLLAILVIIILSNCSEIPENNDPILGIWFKTEALSQEGGSDVEIRQEWIFNDVFLGRYQRYTNDNLEFFTDFSWSLEEGTYIIIYPGSNIPEAEVNLEATFIPEKLAYTNGTTFATRE